MLEYETANPGQDGSPTGEHFNPDLDRSDPRVSFAPNEYALEEGRMSSTTAANSSPNNSSNLVPSQIGHPKEYGAERRPYSDSPAPPHKNDQFTGLEDGGMHANEYVRPRFGDGSSAAPKPAMKNSRADVDRNGNYSNGGNVHSVSSNTNANRTMG